MIEWSKLFRSEKAMIKPVLLEDVTAAEPPDTELVKLQEHLGLRLLKSVVEAAILSGKIREGAAHQAALGRTK